MADISPFTIQEVTMTGSPVKVTIPKAWKSVMIRMRNPAITFQLSAEGEATFMTFQAGESVPMSSHNMSENPDTDVFYVSATASEILEVLGWIRE